MPPPRSRPKNLAGYLSAMSRPVFSAGMSWRVVDAKWDGINRAFAGFDPKKVAAFGPNVVDKLMSNEAVIRSRPKIEAVIDNAQTMLDLDRQYKGFRKSCTRSTGTTHSSPISTSSFATSVPPAPTHSSTASARTSQSTPTGRTGAQPPGGDGASRRFPLVPLSRSSSVGPEAVLVRRPCEHAFVWPTWSFTATRRSRSSTGPRCPTSWSRPRWSSATKRSR